LQDRPWTFIYGFAQSSKYGKHAIFRRQKIAASKHLCCRERSSERARKAFHNPDSWGPLPPLNQVLLRQRGCGLEHFGKPESKDAEPIPLKLLFFAAGLSRREILTAVIRPPFSFVDSEGNHVLR